MFLIKQYDFPVLGHFGVIHLEEEFRGARVGYYGTYQGGVFTTGCRSIEEVEKEIEELILIKIQEKKENASEKEMNELGNLEKIMDSSESIFNKFCISNLE